MKKHIETGVIITNGSVDDGKEVARCCVGCIYYSPKRFANGGCYTTSAWSDKLNCYTGSVGCLSRKVGGEVMLKLDFENIMIIEYLERIGGEDIPFVAIYNQRHTDEERVRFCIETMSDLPLPYVVFMPREQFRNIFGTE